MSGGSYKYIYNQLFSMYKEYVYMTDIKEIAEKLNRCISDGEITDYGRVYAKKYKEQLKIY